MNPLASTPCRAILVGLALCLAGASAAAQEQGLDRLAGPVQAVVERVIDGDTIEVRALVWIGQEVHVRVRLRGVDTPELGSRCEVARELAERARQAVGEALAEPHVALSDITAEHHFGRILASVRTAAGADLGQILLDRGLARPYRRKVRCDWCPADGK